MQSGEPLGSPESDALPDASAPIGDGNYSVQEGDCVESIAFKRRLEWQKVWNDPKNASLKEAGRDPNILLPGDRLYVPPVESKQVDAVTDKLHPFVLKGVPSRLHIRIVEWVEVEGSEQMEARPRAAVPYVLVVDGKTFSGETDSDGWIDQVVSPAARQGKLTIEPGTDQACEFAVSVGGLDPIAAHSGTCQRLANLGFASSPDLQEDSDEFQGAVRAFQGANGLETTGTLDSSTRSKLGDVHGS
jgi:hypothetical protein